MAFATLEAVLSPVAKRPVIPATIIASSKLVLQKASKWSQLGSFRTKLNEETNRVYKVNTYDRTQQLTCLDCVSHQKFVEIYNTM